MRYFINKKSFNSLNIVLSWTLTVTDTEIIISDNSMKRNKRWMRMKVLLRMKMRRRIRFWGSSLIGGCGQRERWWSCEWRTTTKRRTKRQKKNDIKEKKKLKYDAAISAFKSGDYKITTTLNKRTLISEVIRPAVEDVFSRKETITEAFNIQGDGTLSLQPSGSRPL